MHATAPQDRIPTSQKVGYGFGSFLDMWGHWLYQSLAFHVFNIGLKVSPGLISTALGVKILVDAVSDAMFGWVSDNTRSRWGRRRPFILIGGVLSGIGLPLMFAVGRGWTEMEYFWFMLVSLVLYVPVMSCFNMPWVSLGSEMTPDYHERTRLMATKMAIQKIPELAMFGAAQFTTLAIFHDAAGKPDVLHGAQVYTTILGAIMIILSILIFSMTRERYYDRVVAQSAERVPFKDTLYRTLKNRGFRRVLGMMLAYMMATAMVGTLGYYATVYYVCKGDVEMGAKWNTLMGVSGMVFGLVGIPFSVWLSKRVGKRNALLVILALAICAFIGDWFFYNPNIPWLQLFASGFVAFTGAGFWTIYGSTLADVIESDELDTGLRREGSFSACASWISKAGLALGNLGSGWVLQFTGFNADLPAQSDDAIFLMRVFLSGIPAVGLLLAIIVIAGFGLTEKRMYEIRNELEARRGAV
ncbi:MFS transporter [Roseateles paludis]|jgi:GPH family glycoside/pentoside/hexuronide:cation symporter|uniref:MFS transporter n=1 Tax=Roseateles paludis TaxID=3145238 RepID=A0ABV0G2Q8_9BURK